MQESPDDEAVVITTQEVTVTRTEYVNTGSGCSTPRRQIRARSSSYSEKGSNYNYNYTFATVNSSYPGEPDFNQSGYSGTGNLGGHFFKHYTSQTNAEGDTQPTGTYQTSHKSESNKRSKSYCGKDLFRKAHRRCSPKRSASGTSLEPIQKYYRRPMRENTTTNIREYPAGEGCDEFLLPPNKRTGLKRVLSFSTIEDRNPAENWEDLYHDDGSSIFSGSCNQEGNSGDGFQEPDELRSHHLSRRESFDVLSRIKSYMSHSTDGLSFDISSSDDTHSVISSDDSDVVMLIYSPVVQEPLPTVGFDSLKPGTSSRVDNSEPSPISYASECRQQGRQVLGVCSLKQNNQNENIYEQQERVHQKFLAAQAGGTVDPELLIFNIEAIPDRACSNPRRMVLPPLRRYSTSNESLPVIPPLPKIIKSLLSETVRPTSFPSVWELPNDVPPKLESTGSNFDFNFVVKPINDDTYVPLCTQNRIVLHPISCVGKKFQPPQVDRDTDLNIKGSRSEPSLSLLWRPEEMLWDFKYLQYLEPPKQFLDQVSLRTFLIYRPDAMILSKKCSDVDIEIIAVTVNKYKIGYYRAYRLRSYHVEPLGSVPDNFPVDLIHLKSIVANDSSQEWRIVDRDLVIATAIILNEYEDLLPKIIFLLLSDRLFTTSNSLLCYFKHEYENVCDLLYSMKLNAWNSPEYMEVDPNGPSEVKQQQSIDFKRKHKAYVKQLKPPCKLAPLPIRPRVKITQQEKIPNSERYPPPTIDELAYLQKCSEMRERPRIVSCRRKGSSLPENHGQLDCDED